MEPEVVVESNLDWPESLEEVEVECAGSSYINWELYRSEKVDFLHWSKFHDGVADATSTKKKERNLLKYSSAKLSKLTYYQLLGDAPMHSTSEDIKRAYHKACLKYHPDKTGRGEEDEVFLKVKAAFETLSDIKKRKAYDSTMDFDERIPPAPVPAGGVEFAEFKSTYAAVFERNLRFHVKYDPERQQKGAQENGSNNASGSKNGGKKKNKRKSQPQNSTKDAQSPDGGYDTMAPPNFGEDDSPLEQVHKFYDFWTHFESWRDFTLKATELTEHNVDAADSREEKRWMAKEIDRKARALKREEMARINLLVERSMAADPRLRRERQREKQEREDRERQRKLEAETKEREERERQEREKKQRQEEEAKAKEMKTQQKLSKEKEKKQLRKTKQLFRKLVMASFSSGDGASDNGAGASAVWEGSLEAMNDDVELLCSKLTFVEISSLNNSLQQSGNGDLASLDSIKQVKLVADETRQGVQQNTLKAIQEREALRAEADRKKEEAKKEKKAEAKSWSTEELSALAKGVKKYPPGGANRWDTIALFVNNLCHGSRTKEECIEKYNQLASQSSPPGENKPNTSNVPASNGTQIDSDSSDSWTAEQDQQLQAGLAKFPATMEKNERWTNIAKGVTGKSKKDCVARFKAIREAIKKK
eukprot:CAMPEP_0118700604 /NCGR_PEP_ID=MMETSP0800-20121206/16680_1 /TAXON_ID=210618 ORGANISM="Striatella unipunctata, Strain CCMP2910" /NCGR_SAMPLE_ID=MMETSP0800 /ASSEMBLY_ACC=CAM_ASM_000638 /LENGTH=648 /DNA_ID=CAMNT_0006601217 /DNA_START=50 /DNA_END=1995 /DNA_ORIENTATION=+